MEKASVKEVLNGFDDNKYVTPRALSKVLKTVGAGGGSSNGNLTNNSLGLTITDKTYSLGSWSAIDITKDCAKLFKHGDGISFENGLIKISESAKFKYIDMRLYLKWLIPWSGSSSLGNRGVYVYRNGVREWQEFVTCDYGAQAWYGDTYCWLIPVNPGDELMIAIVRGGTSSLLETNIEHGHILVSATDNPVGSSNSGGGCDCTESYHIYSTTEQRVGTWIDGKPLYEKTMSFLSDLSSSITNAFAHGIPNADMVLIEQAWLFNTASFISYPLPITLYNSPTSEDKLSVRADRTNVTFNVGTGWGEGWKKIIVLRYTKLTD